jgi:hypothetical protein
VLDLGHLPGGQWIAQAVVVLDQSSAVRSSPCRGGVPAVSGVEPRLIGEQAVVLLTGRQGARRQSASMGTALIFSPNGRVC